MGVPHLCPVVLLLLCLTATYIQYGSVHSIFSRLLEYSSIFMGHAWDPWPRAKDDRIGPCMLRPVTVTVPAAVSHLHLS